MTAETQHPLDGGSHTQDAAAAATYRLLMRTKNPPGGSLPAA